MAKTFKPRRKPAYKKKAAGRKPAGRKPKANRLPRSTLGGGSFGNMVRNPGNGSCSSSSFSHSIAPSKQVKAFELLGAPNVGFQNKPFVLDGQAGHQASRALDIATTGVLRDIASKVPTGSTTQLPPWRFCFQETLDTFHMTNATSGTLEVDLYDIFPKRDVPVVQTYVPPGQTPTAANTYTLDGFPDEYWRVGARLATSTAANAILSYETNDVYNSSPMDSMLFKTYYKVSKRTRIFLPQGASHKHTVLRHINRVINTSECQQAGGIAALKKCTSHLLIVIRGEPFQADSPEGTFFVTTAAPKLHVVQTARYKWTWIADQAASNFYVDNLNDSTVVKNINPATGVVQQVVQLTA